MAAEHMQAQNLTLEDAVRAIFTAMLSKATKNRDVRAAQFLAEHICELETGVFVDDPMEVASQIVAEIEEIDRRTRPPRPDDDVDRR